MKVAVVILNWNGAEMLRKYLPSIIEFSKEYATVYVADNASDDDSLDYIASEITGCEIIRLPKNYGFAEGYNRALKEIDAEYYVLLNSDVRVDSNWLPPLIEFMDSNPRVAACQPKLLSMSDESSFEYAGACGGFVDRYGYPFCRGRVFEDVERDAGQYDSAIPVMWATGACMMVRSRDYWLVGGLDGRFFAHNEEIDMCWRLRIMAREIYCVPGSRVYHVGGGTLSKGNSMKVYLNFRNNLTMLYKNLPQNDLVRVMCVRWFLDYVAAFKSLLVDRDVPGFIAVFKARRDFRKWLPLYREDRNKMLAYARTDEMSDRMRCSVLWKYYFKKEKTYSEIMK